MHRAQAASQGHLDLRSLLDLGDVTIDLLDLAQSIRPRCASRPCPYTVLESWRHSSPPSTRGRSRAPRCKYAAPRYRPKHPWAKTRCAPRGLRDIRALAGNIARAVKNDYSLVATLGKCSHIRDECRACRSVNVAGIGIVRTIVHEAFVARRTMNDVVAIDHQEFSFS